jgi:predicted AlkP superfamily pyrophosphatase or phosphodiesterase
MGQASAQDKNPSQQPPKLIVLIAIDGLGSNLFMKHEKVYTAGFKRLLTTGAVFSNAWIGHGITVSHSGHVSLVTGNHPNRHGIVDAAFYERKNDAYVFADAFSDSLYSLTGFPEMKSVSSKYVLTTGLAEWATENDPESKSLSVGTGKISSALYSFKPGAEVYWYFPRAAQYVTSTFYQAQLPEWVSNFHTEQLPAIITSAKVWNNTVPASSFANVNKDNYSIEAAGGPNVFPHLYEKEMLPYEKDTIVGRGYWLSSTPFSDVATLELAKKGVRVRLLGQRKSTDVLSIVLSSVDNTAHFYGPSSMETLDVLLRLDNALGSFFDFLDKQIGKDAYIVAISSDHGFPEIPEQTKENGDWSMRIRENDIEKALDEVRLAITNSPQATSTQRAEQIKTILRNYPFVEDVYLPAQLQDNTPSTDEFLELYKKSYRPDRVPRLPFFSLKDFKSPIAEQNVMVRLKRNSMIDLDIVIHGSPYEYDRAVPLIFMGAGVESSRVDKKVLTIDAAPTLANLAKMKRIPQTDGTVIVKRKKR